MTSQVLTVSPPSPKLTQGLRLCHRCKPRCHLCYMSISNPGASGPAAVSGLETCQVGSLYQGSGMTLMALTERPSQTAMTRMLPQAMMPIPTYKTTWLMASLSLLWLVLQLSVPLWRL